MTTDAQTTQPRSIIAGDEGGSPDVAAATTAAQEAFATYRATTPTERGAFLDAVADAIEADRDAIAAAAVAESHLPEARIAGEVGRTTGQLRMFAAVVRQGDHLGVRIDPAMPERTPLARADIRQRQVPLGPVAVFGASNFPLAFSTAGGDTASALAAGCPVVVKGHPAHPVTGYLVARAVSRAVADAGLPAGVFSFLLAGDSGTSEIDLGQSLVQDPRITAVGFTGSRGAGLALARSAAEREVPIPVYAEMSSINPVVILPGALTSDPAALAEAYVGSLTLGSGQFCTNPGLLFLPTGEGGDAFLRAAAEAVAASTGTRMLTSGIADAYAEGTARQQSAADVEVLATGSPGDGDDAPAPQLAAAASTDSPVVTDEIFGAAGVVVRYSSTDDLLGHLAGMEGQLTATLHLDEDAEADLDAARALLPALESRVGRILVGGWPTGVEVGHAMVHGGPYPATSDSRSTSVGSLAIERFQRPVAYQDLPSALLSEAIRDDNPWGLTRRINGELER